jgi:hypothetical protein
MSGDNEPIYPQQEGADNSTKQKRLNLKTILVAGLVLLAISYQIIGSRSTDRPSNSPASGTASPPSAGAVSNTPVENEESSVDSLPAFDTIAPSDRSALVLLQNNLQQINKRLNDITTSQNNVTKRQEGFERDVTNRLDSQLSQLTDMIQAMSASRVLDDRANAGTAFAAGAIIPGSDGLPIIVDSNSASIGSTSLSAQTSSDNFAYRAYATPVVPGKPSQNETVNTLLGIQGSNNSTTPNGEQSTSNALDSISSASSPDSTPVEVAAGAFVRVRNLHGVDCPVGGGSASGQLDDLFSSVPASMIVVGDFRGPNGMTIDLQNAHIIGSCVGQKSTRRARFRITHFSYYDENGKQHYERMAGYINDARDNSLDVAGILVSTRVSDVAKSAAATALSTGANFFSASQFTNVASSATGTTTSSMTGDLGNAAGGASIASAFNEIAAMYADEVKASMEVIHVPSGVEMTFHLLEPFKINLPSISDDENA